MQRSERLAYLFGRYMNKTYTAIEKEEFLLYIQEGDYDEQLKLLLHQQWNNPLKSSGQSTAQADAIFNTILNKQPLPAAVTPVKKIYSAKKWLGYAAAAVVIFSAGFYLLKKEQPQNKSTAAAPLIDVAPGTDKAVLTLADGSTILLDSAGNGGLTQQGNTTITKLNGQIAYAGQPDVQDNGIPLLNTLSTAKGNQYQLLLADGSRVWLNAASSIRFPAAFKGKERSVEITGEAYFEIAENAAMPFKVHIKGGEIKVLGTHFNVNTYEDESGIKTTLLQGAVQVSRDHGLQLLKPGQQARFTGNTGIELIKDVDLQEEMAWKDGFFSFNNTNIHTLMKQIARWYDVEVDFKGKITEEGFTGKVPRSVPLSKLLRVLEQYDIHFKMENKKVTVLP